MINSTDILFTLGNTRREYFKEIMVETGLSYIQIEILLFLEENPQFHSINEIVGEDRSSVSFLSVAFVDLINKDYIQMKSRKKLWEESTDTRYVLTKNAKKVIRVANQRKQEFHKIMYHNISQEEMDMVEDTFIKMTTNLMLYRRV